MTFEQATRDLIFDDENVIGYSDDVARYFHFCFENEMDDEDRDLWKDDYDALFENLEKVDGLVHVWYHPMGSLTVYKLNEEYVG